MKEGVERLRQSLLGWLRKSEALVVSEKVSVVKSEKADVACYLRIVYGAQGGNIPLSFDEARKLAKILSRIEESDE